MTKMGWNYLHCNIPINLQKQAAFILYYVFYDFILMDEWSVLFILFCRILESLWYVFDLYTYVYLLLSITVLFYFSSSVKSSRPKI
jgi:hypothetical protein